MTPLWTLTVILGKYTVAATGVLGPFCASADDV